MTMTKERKQIIISKTYILTRAALIFLLVGACRQKESAEVGEVPETFLPAKFRLFMGFLPTIV